MKNSPIRSVEMVEVVKTVSLRGDGNETPIREVVQYWNKDGTMLAENDPIKEEPIWK